MEGNGSIPHLESSNNRLVILPKVSGNMNHEIIIIDGLCARASSSAIAFIS
ncbi:hypothetical protein HanRHA438_Chr14g0660281 [Helianthus annuus]|nr:hypothetical protein HanRHA438_Chr14g0660281 [Helianthus annuus]